jgi:hypothetical protein
LETMRKSPFSKIVVITAERYRGMEIFSKKKQGKPPQK